MASPSTTRQWKYDVFLSFRGEDTRNNFTSHLYAALSRRKIETFIDCQLKRGDDVSPALLKAIEDSNISIIVLSKNYASSSWCLDELLKILESKNTMGQIVLPVFYQVNPSDVRKQTGSFGEAFAKHEKQFKKTKQKVLQWRAALTEAANLSGWHLNHQHGLEAELVEKIAKDVLKKLNHISSSDLGGLIGIESRIDKIESLLCIGLVDVHVVGIWGMGGIGKTTIARAMFDRIANQFEGCCFLANVREESAKCGVHRLQEELFSKLLDDGDLSFGTSSLGLTFMKNRLHRKKVLIVLDDVENFQQLKILAGDPGWFGLGSRIIITSRDKQVLKTGVDEMYEVEELNYYESLQLFSLNAFKQNHPAEDYMELSNQVVYYAKGIPLALRVLGCFLFGRCKRDWESALNKLRKNLNKDIQNVLRISYDALDDEEKEIFLDISCFFKGEDRDHVITILDGCGFSTEIGISVLIDKCLVTIVSNRLLMHDLLQEMGWSIVRQKSIKDPGKISRLWDPQDICNLFKKKSGSEAIESISLDMSKVSELQLSSDAFRKMHQLRLLKFFSSNYNKGYIEDDTVHLCQGLEILSNELRYLYWHRYPLKSLPSNFNPGNLVELDMHHSNVEYLWREMKHVVNLRQIDLSYSQHLNETPDLSSARNLEIMVLDGCNSLTKFPKISWSIKKLNLGETAIEEVPPAIEYLNKLVALKLDNCRKLKNLPSSIRNLTSLTELDLRGCSNITKFPEISGNMKYLFLGETAIEELPSSVECLPELVLLRLENCTSLKSVSSSISKLKSLETFDLFGCSKLDGLPEISESMERLETLNLDGTPIKELPSSIDRLSQLSLLSLRNCKNIVSLPNSFFNLTSLSSLILSGWSEVDEFLENLPLSLLSGLCSLTELHLSDCNLVELPSSFSYLSSLEVLDLSGNNFESLCLKPFSSLTYLNTSYCKRLQSIEDFPSPLRLTNLEAHECTSLEMLPTPADLAFTVEWSSVQLFLFSNCWKLNENAHRNILADAQQRIQVMATNARGTASAEEYMEWDFLGASVSICFAGNEIPYWFSDQNEGSSVTIELPPQWCSKKFLGFTLCVVVSFEDYCDNWSFGFECKCCFEANDGDCNDRDFYLYGFGVDSVEYKPRILWSDHVFLLYSHQLYAMVVQSDERDHWFSTYQSCHKASFEFYPQDGYRRPLPNCKVKKCGVSLLFSEEEHTEGGDSSNEAECTESGSKGSSNEEDENQNAGRLEENETNSEANTLWLAQGKELIMKIFLVGITLIFFWWCFLGIATTDGSLEFYQ